ncbi:hypothetical protein M0222_25345 [Myxococcus fulvus]|nr:hypothetical protein [Myxococcus fulvus]
MVHVEGEDVLGVAELQELSADERAGGEVEGPLVLLAQPSLDLRARGLFIESAQVDPRQR